MNLTTFKYIYALFIKNLEIYLSISNRLQIGGLSFCAWLRE